MSDPTPSDQNAPKPAETPCFSKSVGDSEVILLADTDKSQENHRFVFRRPDKSFKLEITHLELLAMLGLTSMRHRHMLREKAKALKIEEPYPDETVDKG